MSYFFVWIQSYGFYGTLVFVATLILTSTSPLGFFQYSLSLPRLAMAVNLSLIASPILFILPEVLISIRRRRNRRKKDVLGVERKDMNWAIKGSNLPGFLKVPFTAIDAILTAKKNDWDTEYLSDRIWYWVEVVRDVICGASIWAMLAYCVFNLIHQIH